MHVAYYTLLKRASRAYNSGVGGQAFCSGLFFFGGTKSLQTDK